MKLLELLCFHGYDTWVSTDEKDLLDKCPIYVNTLTPEEKETCRILLRKNMILVKNSMIIRNGG